MSDEVSAAPRTKEQVLTDLAAHVKAGLTQAVRVATNAYRKSGIVTADEIKATVDTAAAEWTPEP